MTKDTHTDNEEPQRSGYWWPEDGSTLPSGHKACNARCRTEELLHYVLRNELSNRLNGLPTPQAAVQGDDPTVANVLQEAKSKTNSVDPLVHIAWLIEGINVYLRTNGKRGHSIEDCKRYVVSTVHNMLQEARMPTKSSGELEEIRHDIHMQMLGKSESAKDCGELTVVPLGHAVTVALEILATQTTKLQAEAEYGGMIYLVSYLAQRNILDFETLNKIKSAIMSVAKERKHKVKSDA